MITSLGFYNEDQQEPQTESSSSKTPKQDKKELTNKELDVSEYEDSNMKISTTSYKVISD